MTDKHTDIARRWSAGLAAISALIAIMAILGYATHQFWLVRLRPNLQAMSVSTALLCLALSGAALSDSQGNIKTARWLGAATLLASVILLGTHIASGSDPVSPILVNFIFGYRPPLQSETSLATALCAGLLGVGFVTHPQKQPGEFFAIAVMMITGLAALVYAYDVRDLYALLPFNTLSLRTAITLFALATSLLLLNTEAGVSSLIFASGPLGSLTRRQLAYLVAIPFVAFLLLRATTATHLGPGAAIGMLVVLTVTPIAGLILRDARASLRLAREQREKEVATAANFELEQRYRTLFTGLPSGFCVVEMAYDGEGNATDYRFLEVNPAFAEQTGLSNAKGRWMRSLATEHEQSWFDTYGAVAMTGEPVRFERAAAALGRYFDVYAFRVDDPESRHVAVLFNDISERREMEMELQRLNQMLELRVEERTLERDRAWKNSRDLQAVMNGEGVIVAANEAWMTLLGWTPEEVVGKSHLFFNDPDRYALSQEALAVARTGPMEAYENRFRHKDGTYRWLSWVAAQQGGNIYASGRHISAEKEAAAALEEMQEQLRQSQKMEAVGQLTGGLAHDFNNLLAGISGSLELVQTRMRQGRMADVDRFLGTAQGAAKRAAALTHRLLAFSRRQTLDPKPAEVNALVMGLEDMIRRTMGPAITVEIVGAVGLWTALVDHSQLENSLLNLCINARDAMPDGGRLTIETANKWIDAHASRERDLPAGQYLSLCVTDSGTGMSAETIRRAFDPFFTTKPIGEGTGLGLSMVYGFARQSGGQVRIYSELGQGTTLCIYLPRHHFDERSYEVIDAIREASSSSHEGTILIVDDEPTVRLLIVEILQDMGFTALEAGDGAGGLTILNSDAAIDLLITDVGLPGGMNGRQLADAARVRRPKLKVLFITGYAENAVIGNGHLDVGMEIVTKPFALDDLASRIKSMIDA